MQLASPSRPGPILIIDDDPDIAEILRLILEVQGYEVVTARHGAAGLEALHGPAHGASLVVVDLMMPVMDGWSVHEALQRDPQLRHIPMVLITADFRAVPRAQALGVAAVLRKPFGADEFLDTVRTLVPASAS